MAAAGDTGEVQVEMNFWNIAIPVVTAIAGLALGYFISERKRRSSAKRKHDRELLDTFKSELTPELMDGLTKCAKDGDSNEVWYLSDRIERFTSSLKKHRRRFFDARLRGRYRVFSASVERLRDVAASVGPPWGEKDASDLRSSTETVLKSYSDFVDESWRWEGR